MLGPADLEDWTFDERDMVSAMLRRHDAVHAVVCGADREAAAFPLTLREHVIRFASAQDVALDDLCMVAEWLGCFAQRAA